MLSQVGLSPGMYVATQSPTNLIFFWFSLQESEGSDSESKYDDGANNGEYDICGQQTVNIEPQTKTVTCNTARGYTTYLWATGVSKLHAMVKDIAKCTKVCQKHVTWHTFFRVEHGYTAGWIFPYHTCAGYILILTCKWHGTLQNPQYINY